METEGSLPFSQKPATGPYPESDESSPHTPPPFSTKIHSNIIFPFPIRSSEWPLPFKFSNRNVVCVSVVFHACYMSRPITSSL